MEALLLVIGILSLALLLKIVVTMLRVGFYVLILPLKIVVGVVGALLSLFVVLPLAIAAGVVTLVLSPLILLVPFVPLFLIALGVWLIVRSYSSGKRPAA
jgi:hypothetical protein